MHVNKILPEIRRLLGELSERDGRGRQFPQKDSLLVCKAEVEQRTENPSATKESEDFKGT